MIFILAWQIVFIFMLATSSTVHKNKGTLYSNNSQFFGVVLTPHFSHYIKWRTGDFTFSPNKVVHHNSDANYYFLMCTYLKYFCDTKNIHYHHPMLLVHVFIPVNKKAISRLCLKAKLYTWGNKHHGWHVMSFSFVFFCKLKKITLHLIKGSISSIL